MTEHTGSVSVRRVERAVVLSAILASSMAFIDSTALDVVAPALQRDLGIDGRQLLWVINAYLLTLSSLILVGGSLGDIYGRKRVFMIGIGLFTVASMLCGVATSPTFLIAARALQGVGGALMVPGSLAIISATVASERRGRAIGTWSMFSTLTTMFGPILGGWFASQGLWRLIFFVNAPLALIALFVLATRVPESRDENAVKRLDILGAALATIGLAGITFGFLQASDPALGLRDPVVLAALGIGVAALVAFLVVEARSDHPMMPLRLFRSRTFAGTNALTFFLYAALRIAPFFLMLNLIQVQGYPEEVAGFALLPFTILLTVLSRWAGGLIDRIGARIPLIVGPAITGFGYLLLAFPGLTAGPNAYWLTYFPGIVLLGIGMGITVAPLTTAVMSSAPRGSSGIASGINNAVARTAGVLGVAIVGSLAIALFSASLNERAVALRLPPPAYEALIANSAALGATAIPEGLDVVQAEGASTAIRLAFVDTFAVVAVISAALSWISALMAALLVEGKPAREKAEVEHGVAVD